MPSKDRDVVQLTWERQKKWKKSHEKRFRLVPIGNQRRDPIDRTTNEIILGDNLPVMQQLISEGLMGSVDLIYIDPPFWSGDDYFTKKPKHGSQVKVQEDKLAYRDTWDGGLAPYLEMMNKRLVLMKEMLSDTGSLFVHVDWHAGHYIKVLLDKIFGMENLRNEIIWHYGGPSPLKSSFPRKHDVIFFYSKTGTYTFHPQYNPLKDYLFKRARKNPDGRLWVDQNVGKISDSKFNELTREGRIFKTKTGNYRRKQFLDEMKGDMVDDVWTIPIINSQSRERVGYPTQKPLGLLSRVIQCASNEGDLVTDFFCGSGTTLEAAERCGRRWIGVDCSPMAIDIARERLAHLENVRFRCRKLVNK
ncbi:methyltransferase domain-containing protein [Candidatus Bathyarchaeota archaeon]|nr:methyltransferase domain-containing protein [Candidatus Bathyarchaeota archaeon]